MILTSIISLGTSDTTELLGYAGILIDDLTPIWLPLVAVGVGMIVVISIIHSIRGD